MMSLDTINYEQVDVTGWPLRFGHLFFGANDLSVKSTMDKAISIDFDIRVEADHVQSGLYPNKYSGHRILVGAKVEWDEVSPRYNKIYYLETDLIQSDGYSASYHDPNRPLCKDGSTIAASTAIMVNMPRGVKWATAPRSIIRRFVQIQFNGFTFTYL